MNPSDELGATPQGKPSGIRRIIPSNDLFQGEREVVIQHGEDFYRLMITKAGKLILNK